jgi:glycosyltransferase involved in cell wall biosynthesis
MSNRALVSVIIPLRNSEKTISAALESVINQTHVNLEIIVVNDYSTDNSMSIIQSFLRKDSRIKCYIPPFDDPHRFDDKLNKNINAGYSARNFGIEKSKGAYLTFQDSDDVSFLNRIETQMNLLLEHKASSVVADWVQYKDEHAGKKFDVENYRKTYAETMIGPQELYDLSQKTKGFCAKISPAINRAIPFHFKRKKILNKLFWGGLHPYPGLGGIPLVTRDVADKIRFRKLSERVWPSFMGRGTDRDFNFQVAETFKNSYVFRIPLYMWRVQTENQYYADKNIGSFVS